MKIIKRAETPEGVKIVLVDWSEDYSCYGYSAHIHAYPTATKTDYEEILKYPQQGKTFLLEIDCETEENAIRIFEQLKSGEIGLKDCGQYFARKKYVDFI